MKIEFKKAIPYDIKIRASHNNGFIVKVGCSETVFADKQSLISAIEAYLNDPEGMEKVYNTIPMSHGEVRAVGEIPPPERRRTTASLSDEPDRG